MLRELARRAGFASLEALARAAQIHAGTARNLARQGPEYSTVGVLRKVANALGMPAWALLFILDGGVPPVRRIGEPPDVLDQVVSELKGDGR